MEKPVIHEVIIVEGRDDTRRLKEALICETIETNGSAINERTMQEIEVALNTRGAIILTDPDFPGHKIRTEILKRFPHIKEAFISRQKAKGRHGIGVEHASIEDIRSSLKNVLVNHEINEETISNEDMQLWGLSGRVDSKARREHLTAGLNIGYANAKQLKNKLNRYRIDKEEINSILSELKKDE
ncbi:ribonuclease M5 [Salinicoccus kekensis]|uniref:Ribonuclease M5 n=1 Tax=Salinicoccus kekensis TaxID=714307 RepID=A0A285UMX9_9STAP|nr:ribonuclease M5 [Salinicoccus kekensis]SOC43189.1 RNAse M5 [Salinicoccus kekensis]